MRAFAGAPFARSASISRSVSRSVIGWPSPVMAQKATTLPAGESEASSAATQHELAKRLRRSPHDRARSRMNAFRHGLAAVSINTTTGTADDHPFADDSCMGAMYQRLRQIEVERLKVLNEVHNLSRSEDMATLHTAVRRLAALERYSQRSHAKLKKHIF